MLIENYFQQINSLITACQFVQSFELSADKRSGYRGFIRGNICFIDNSLLHLREFVSVKNGVNRGKYAYQYMDAANNLIFRYDNAQHHHNLNLANYLPHKHQGSEDNIGILMLVRYAFFSPLRSGRGVGGEGDTS